MNGGRYRAIIRDCFWPELKGMDLRNVWFQQDGATCHTISLLNEKFRGFIILCDDDDVNRPVRPCALIPLYYFLWGYVKSRVYVDRPDDLRNNILSHYSWNWTCFMSLCH